MFHNSIYIPVKVSEPESPLADNNHLYVKRPLDAVRRPVEELNNRYVFTKEELDAYVEAQVNPKYAKVDNPVLQHLLDFKHDKFMETTLWYCPEDGKLVVTKKDENAPTKNAVKMVENQMYNF